MNLDKLITNKIKLNQFAAKGIETAEDLALYFPRKYYDFRKVTPINKLTPGEMAVVYGEVKGLTDSTPCSYADLSDGQGNRIRLTFFGNKYIFSALEIGKSYYAAGKVSEYNGWYSILNPVFAAESASKLRIMPVYSKVKGMSEQYLKDSIKAAVKSVVLGRTSAEEDMLAESLGLCTYKDMLKGAHVPKSEGDIEKSEERLGYERIYDFYEGLSKRQKRSLSKDVHPFTEFEKSRSLVRGLPYKLTVGQKNALAEISSEFKVGKQVNAIVTGDVGCGKTMVAIILSMMAIENGYQAILAAPTKILAQQHEKTFREALAPFGVTVRGLYGTTKKREREEILKGTADGDIDILVGTHAALSPEISFKSLGLTVTDEEQKFGTVQKELLETGEKAAVHHIAMTATPIPRSLAKTLYTEDTQVIRIEDLPEGRSLIKTEYTEKLSEAFDAVREEVEKGHKAYVVCPFIEESESEAFKEVATLDKTLERFEKYCGRYPQLKGLYTSISGDMKASDIEKNVEDFAGGDKAILFSTSIVEVGVNVPEASVIAVLSAERFGLSSLHQMRGRVGRSDIPSRCVLASKQYTERIDIMVNESSGFVIAEKDLALRGPGKILGLEQTGNSKEIDAIISRPDIAEKVKEHFFGGK